ncbi:hypothetical protein D910_00906, partial [Dendroctonus ponderosae]
TTFDQPTNLPGHKSTHAQHSLYPPRFACLLTGILQLFCRMAQPIFLGQLLQFYLPTEKEVSMEQAYWYAAGVVFCSLINILITHPFMMGVLHLGMKIRISCCSLIYRKSLKLSKTALGQTTVVNLLSNDVNRFDVAVIFAHHLWLGPLQTALCTYLMYLQVEVAAVVGVLLLIAFIPLQIYFGKMISVFRLKTAMRTDERVRLMNEIVSGIQVIKMYAWEKPFAKLVDAVRSHQPSSSTSSQFARYEIKSITKTSYMRGIQLSFIMYSTRISIFGSILAYVLLGHNITAEKVFVLTCFYNILRQTMTVFFPSGIGQVRTSRSSKHRFNATIAGIFLKNASAKWTATQSDNTLTNITLSVTPGALLAVIGPVGSGKSSLFHVILQELVLNSGNLRVNGEISYASQEPWLFA